MNEYKQCPLCNSKLVNLGNHLENMHQEKFNKSIDYLRAIHKLETTNYDELLEEVEQLHKELLEGE